MRAAANQFKLPLAPLPGIRHGHRVWCGTQADFRLAPPSAPSATSGHVAGQKKDNDIVSGTHLPRIPDA